MCFCWSLNVVLKKLNLTVAVRTEVEDPSQNGETAAEFSLDYLGLSVVTGSEQWKCTFRNSNYQFEFTTSEMREQTFGKTTFKVSELKRILRIWRY